MPTTIFAWRTDLYNLLTYHSLDRDQPFVNHTNMGLRLATSQRRLLFSALDLDPACSTPNIPILRFLRFGGVGTTTIDIPITSLIPADDLLVGFRSQTMSFQNARFVLSWDGSDKICVVFRGADWHPLQPEPEPRAWFISLSADVVAAIGTGEISRSA